MDRLYTERIVIYDRMHLSADGDIYYDAMEVEDVSEEILLQTFGQKRELPARLMETVRMAHVFHEEGKLDQAHRTIKETMNNLDVDLSLPFFLAIRDSILDEKHRVLKRLEDLDRTVADLKASESNPLKIAYAFEPSTSTHVLTCQAIVSAALEELVCLLREFDLIETWNKYVDHSELLEVLGMMNFSFLCQLNLPWPVSNREVRFAARGSDVMEDTGKFLVTLRSIQSQATTTSSCLAIDLLDGCALCMEPKTSSKGEASTHCKLELRLRDSRVRWAPVFFVNLILKVIAPWIFRRVHRDVLPELRDPTSEYAKRLVSNASLYLHLKTRRLSVTSSGSEPSVA